MGAFALELADFPLQRCDQGCGDLVLKREDVGEVAVVPLGPNVVAGGGVDQLRSDANALAALADAPFDDVSDPEVAAAELQFDLRC